MKKSLLIIGIGLIVVAGVWNFALSPGLTQRIAADWSWEADFVGISTWADFETGAFPEEDDISRYERSIKVVSADSPAGSVTLEDHYITHDVNTGVVTWEYLFSAPVDPTTGLHISDDYQGDVFAFPRNVEQKTYNLRQTSYEGIPVAFQGEEDIEGLSTYHFAFAGEINNTNAYRSTDDYEGVDVEPGQVILCPELKLDIWVEPVTGEIAKMADSCLPGDVVVDEATGEQLYPLSRWAGENTGEDVIRRVSQIQGQRTSYLITSTYLPIALVIGGLLALVIGVIPMLTTTKREQQPALAVQH